MLRIEAIQDTSIDFHFSDGFDLYTVAHSYLSGRQRKKD
jgi:hypothetical protein